MQVKAVDEKDVSVPGGAVHAFVASRSPTPVTVAGLVTEPDVGLNLDDASDQIDVVLFINE
jgi:hypothetical protein